MFINRTVPDLSLEEVLGKTVYDFAPPGFHDEIKACFRGVLETGRQGRYDVVYKSKIGEEAYFESRVGPVYMKEEIVGFTVNSSDITAERRADAEHARLAALVGNSTDFILLADLGGKVVYVNDCGLAIVGLDGLDHARNTVIADYVLEADRKELDQRIFHALWTEGHWSGEYRFRHFGTGTTIPVDINSFIVRHDQTGAPLSIAVVARDITERHAAEEALSRSELQLRQAQKMEAVGLLAGGVAHDFNNMLTIIGGYTQLVLTEGEPNEEDREKLEEVESASKRASALTQQLLAFSRRQVLQPKVLDVNALVHNMHSMLSRLIGEDIQFVTRPPGEPGHVLADPGQIEQVVMNLVINASDAMPRGGVLCLGTETVTANAAARDHASLPDGSYVRIEVADTGAGMDENVLSHIFDPFFTTKELGQGTGLGLATVYGIVKQSGGYIHVASHPGQGTTFRMYFPIVDEEPTELEDRDTTVTNGTETVLVVEDDCGVRSLSSEVLSARGYDVIVAKDGVEALELVEHKNLPIDLLMTDVVMPKMNGQELAGKLVERSPETRILFMSGYSDTLISSRGVLRSDAQLIRKPFTPQSLATKVREVLDGNLAAADDRGCVGPEPIES